MDVVYPICPVIDANVTKDIRVKIAMVIHLFPSSLPSIGTHHISCSVRMTGSGCASNPCSVGICYQLNQNGPSYVCICPDGTLNLSCNSSSMISFLINCFRNLNFRRNTESLWITDSATTPTNH